jgi:TetR/AcrR family transcriptional regulator, transcriptional repressor for nem operon
MSADYGFDIARGGKQIRSYLTEKINSEIKLLTNLLPQADSVARSRAILTVSALLGAVELARVVSDESLSREILESTRKVLNQLTSRKTQPMDGDKESCENT